MTSSGAARGALFLALIALAGCRSEVPSGKRPAVVIAMIDTLRADYVGAYGFAGPISPAIDRIAAEGVVFESCSAPAPWTKPSIASLFSGLEPEVHQVLTEQGKYRERGKAGESERFNVLADDIDTLAEAFQSAGYRTAAFVANPWIRPELGFAQGFDEFHGDENAAQAEPGTKFPGGVVLDQLRDFLVRRPQEKPVLLYLHFMEVHGPYDAPEEDYRAIVSSDSLGPPQPLLPVRFKLMPPYLRTASWVDEAEAKDVRTWRARYAAGVRVVDRHIATLRQQLEQAGIWDDAIVVVTSDHGEQLYDHQGWDHGYSLFEDQLHVPLIFRLRARQQAGKRVAATVSLIDLLPTLTRMTQIGGGEGGQGHDRSGLLRDASAGLREGAPRMMRPDVNAPQSAGKAAWQEHDASYGSAVKWNPEAASIRVGRHKLISTKAGQPPQLFDLVADPGERNDLATTETELVTRMSAKLDERRAANIRLARLGGAAKALPESVTERLRNLGYLDEEKSPQ